MGDFAPEYKAEVHLSPSRLDCPVLDVEADRKFQAIKCSVFQFGSVY